MMCQINKTQNINESHKDRLPRIHVVKSFWGKR